jgi:hypothetical protein
MCPLVSAFSRSFFQTERARVAPSSYWHIITFSFQWTSCVAAGQRRVPSIGPLLNFALLHLCMLIGIASV